MNAAQTDPRAAADAQLSRLGANLDIPAQELRHYQLGRILPQLSEGKSISQIGGIEYECHAEILIQERALGRTISTATPYGVKVPWQLFGMRAEYTVGTPTAGGNLVANVMQWDNPIDVLRPFSVAAALGVTPDTGFSGNPVYPRITAASTPQEVAEGSAATESEATFDNVQASPHTVTSWNRYSRLFRMQVGEGLIRTDILRGLGTEVDRQILIGTGSSNQPTGVLNASGVNAVSGTTANFATLCTAEADVLSANGLQDRRSAGWAGHPLVASLLAQRYEDGTTKVNRLWQGALHTGRVLSDVAYSSTLLPTSTLVFGDWSAVTVPFYGIGIELAVDPYSGFAAGDIALRAMVSMDVITRHGASFSVISSIT